MEFVYVKDNHMARMSTLSVVTILVDDEIVREDAAADGVQTTKLTIPQGYHFVTWKYSKVNTELTKYWAAELFNITINGVHTDAA